MTRGVLTAAEVHPDGNLEADCFVRVGSWRSESKKRTIRKTNKRKTILKYPHMFLGKGSSLIIVDKIDDSARNH